MDLTDLAWDIAKTHSVVTGKQLHKSVREERREEWILYAGKRYKYSASPASILLLSVPCKNESSFPGIESVAHLLSEGNTALFIFSLINHGIIGLRAVGRGISSISSDRPAGREGGKELSQAHPPFLWHHAIVILLRNEIFFTKGTSWNRRCF